MGEIFYQGEDIALTIELFADDTMSEPADLTLCEADLLLYTRHDGPAIRLSTAPETAETLPIVRESDTRLSALVPAARSRELAPGVLTAELMITEEKGTETETRRIAVSSHLHLEPSILGNAL